MTPIVDAHVHVWDLRTGLYPRRERLRDEGDPHVFDYLIDNLLDDAAGVPLAAAVHVEACPDDGLAEVRHVSGLADAAGSRLPLGIVANADLAAADAADALARLAAFPRVRGIRQALNRQGETRDLLADSRWRSGFVLLRSHGLSFDLQLSPTQAPAAARLAADHPGTAIALNHLGWPKERTPAGWRQWRQGLRVLADCPNVHVKLSGVGMFEADWTLESIRPYVYESIDAFGVERAMFASNFPIDRRWRSYAEVWAAYGELAAGFGAAEAAALLGGNARRFYRI
jgi:predicted TIM-barrel fold metal-dependent hydrolase